MSIKRQTVIIITFNEVKCKLSDQCSSTFDIYKTFMFEHKVWIVDAFEIVDT